MNHKYSNRLGTVLYENNDIMKIELIEGSNNVLSLHLTDMMETKCTQGVLTTTEKFFHSPSGVQKMVMKI